MSENANPVDVPKQPQAPTHLPINKETVDRVVDRFKPWSNFVCWLFCNEQKQPVDKKTGYMCRWRTNPQDNIITLNELAEWINKNITWGGFGVILGQDTLLCCVDLDHCLDENGFVINSKVAEFMDAAKTYAEVSTSGRGLHLFFNLEQPHEEFKLRADFSDGKLYTDRFIKLTGIQYKNYDYPVITLNDRAYDHIRKEIGEDRPQPTTRPKSSEYLGKETTEWKSLLDESGIITVTSAYTGNIRHGRRVVESFKIQCPNISKHSEQNSTDITKDLAVLNRYDDGTSSLTCPHHSCDPATRPNLLKKLWDQIRQSRVKKAKDLLKKFGCNLK